MDDDLNVLWCDDLFSQRLGYSVDELKGRPLAEIIPAVSASS